MLVYNYYQKNNKIIQCKGITISYRNNLLNNNKIKFNLDGMDRRAAKQNGCF